MTPVATFPLPAPSDAYAETPVDVVIDTILVAAGAAMEALDAEIPIEDLDTTPDEPPIFQPVLDKDGTPIGAIVLEREPGTRLFQIRLVTTAGPAIAGTITEAP